MKDLNPIFKNKAGQLYAIEQKRSSGLKNLYWVHIPRIQTKISLGHRDNAGSPSSGIRLPGKIQKCFGDLLEIKRPRLLRVSLRIYFLTLLRMKGTAPTKPDPRRSIVVGSGTLPLVPVSGTGTLKPKPVESPLHA